VPPITAPPDVVPVVEPLVVPVDDPLGEALGDVVLVFWLLLTFVLVLLFTFESLVVLGEALGLDVVVPCVESVDCVPEPALVD
jgi:hypothetical protein